MEVDFGGEADELLEILGDELRPAVTDDARPGLGKLQVRPLGSPLPLVVPAEPSGFSHEMGAVAVPSLSISRSNPPRRHEKYKGA